MTGYALKMSAKVCCAMEWHWNDIFGGVEFRQYEILIITVKDFSNWSLLANSHALCMNSVKDCTGYL